MCAMPVHGIDAGGFVWRAGLLKHFCLGGGLPCQLGSVACAIAWYELCMVVKCLISGDVLHGCRAGGA
jgi:hypothetical protein